MFPTLNRSAWNKLPKCLKNETKTKTKGKLEPITRQFLSAKSCPTEELLSSIAAIVRPPLSLSTPSLWSIWVTSWTQGTARSPSYRSPVAGTYSSPAPCRTSTTSLTSGTSSAVSIPAMQCVLTVCAFASMGLSLGLGSFVLFLDLFVVGCCGLFWVRCIECWCVCSLLPITGL